MAEPRAPGARRPGLGAGRGDPAAAPILRIAGVAKAFGQVRAVDDVSLDIGRGEFFSLLGGSGCGKSTLLRILAGFEQPDAGRVEIDGADVTATPPYARPVNMMFQSYALFPHMTVEGNVAFGLKQEGTPRAEIADRVAAVLDLVQLRAQAGRRPHQLSGGQRQRVALARALVKRPKILLLDEPLAALDKKLRAETQFELVAIQERIGITFIVVTHDQEEAMTMSSRIGVMDAGRIVQVGTPIDIYEHPRSRFVAGFIGDVNLLEGRVEGMADGVVTVRTDALAAPLAVADEGDWTAGQAVAVAIRPEKIAISRTAPDATVNIAEGVVRDIAYLGDISIYHVETSGGRRLVATRPNLRVADEPPFTWDDQVHLSWAAGNAVLVA
ncbi:MAG: ABC transporter ATP-binding protein [Alphaproteobacteria bacterium]